MLAPGSHSYIEPCSSSSTPLAMTLLMTTTLSSTLQSPSLTISSPSLPLCHANSVHPTPNTTAHQAKQCHPPTNQCQLSAATSKQPSPTITHMQPLDQHTLLCNTSPHSAKPSPIATSPPTTMMRIHTATSNETPTKIIKRKTTTLHPTSIDHIPVCNTTLNSTHTHPHPLAPPAIFPSNSFTVPSANTDHGIICQPLMYPILATTTSKQAFSASPSSPPTAVGHTNSMFVVHFRLTSSS